MNNKFLRNQLILVLILLGVFVNLNAQSVEEGKKLFKDKICASCHNKSMSQDLVGPALAGVEGRWESKEDLFQWIKEPQKLLDANHKYATDLFEKFNKIPMTPNPTITDKEIESILLYIRSQAGEEIASAGSSSDTALALKGKELFKASACAACHDAKMKTDLVGPNLTGVESRWENKNDIYEWIRNPQKFLDAKHPYATKLFEKFNKIPMTPNPGLSNEDIDAILAFISNPTVAIPVAKAKDASNSYLELSKTATAVETNEPGFFSSFTFYIILFVLLLLVTFLLAYLVAKTRVQAFRDEFGEEKKLCVLWLFFANRTVLKFALFGFMVFGIYYTAVRGIDLGRQQGYQPDQPIAYSHKVHAGDNAIDCEFCHDAARRSRHAMIPATNTCMKCHKAIKTGTQYGTQELTKVYASIGFDPSTGKYIEDYNNMSQEDVKNIFTKWIKKNNKEDVAEEQWKNIVASLTNEHKTKVQGTIEWTRIHNLPDHVYFNHSQHVTVAKLECQDCHGPIEEMEVVSQYAPLSMGWCVNCHRNTGVKFEDNKYYDQYFAKYHEEIHDGKRSKVSVADIGGIDCQKCHY